MLAPKRVRAGEEESGSGFDGGAELVLLDLQSGLPAFEACDASTRHQFQWSFIVELCGPTDGQFHTAAGQQHVFAREQNAGTTHIDGSANATLVSVTLAEDFVADFPFNGKSIGRASVFVLCV
jgi:hypothetical protein